MLGWMLDALDVMLYSFALLSMQKEFGLTGAQAGTLTTVTLAAAAIGGTMAGGLADRFGRTRVLMGSILTYSIFTALIATSHSFAELLVWRSLVGLGLGAEWSAGTVLVAESWNDDEAPRWPFPSVRIPCLESDCPCGATAGEPVWVTFRQRRAGVTMARWRQLQ